MSTGGVNPAGAEDQLEFQIDHVRISPSRTRLAARLGNEIIHRDEINIYNANARARFAAAIGQRGMVEASDVEELLFEIVGELDELYDDPDVEAPRSSEYRAVGDEEVPAQRGLYEGDHQLTNFTMVVVEDTTVQDDVESERVFRCRAALDGTTKEFNMKAGDFASNTRLIEGIFAAIGAKAQIHCKPAKLRTAISAVSAPESREDTTNFGWNAQGNAYLVPSGRIDADGFHPAEPDDAIRVDLGEEQCARHLDLRPLEPAALAEAKRHVVDDFLRLNEPRVMFCLLGAIALSVLFRFTTGMSRFALWLTGLTGEGKSFAAKLAQNFFGDFPVETGDRVGSWSSTANFLQRQGYYFRDAFFLIDDYKKEVTKTYEVTKLLQNYADGSARGRLNSDATTNVSRPIRGMMVATGEDIPEHTASSMARTIVVPFGRREKDAERGARCLSHRLRYSGVMADFIRHLIAGGATHVFAEQVTQYRQLFLQGIVGRQNDLRIAGNFAMLAAATAEFACYLGDAWPDWERDVARFIEQDLIALRDEMLGMVHEQQASEVFLATLEILILGGSVHVSGYYPPGAPQGLRDSIDRKPLLGRRANTRDGNLVFVLATSLAIEAVQESLRRQGKPPLPATDRALIDQLAGEGLLLDADDRPIDPTAGGDRTRDVRLGAGTRKAFRILACHVIGEAASESMSRRSS